MKTLALMTAANRLNTSKPIEFERFRTEGAQMRTLLAEPNLKRLKA